MSNHADGKWHHLVGVMDAAGLRLYFDEGLVCTLNDSAPMAYDAQKTLQLGRNGNGAPDGDFEGAMDDFRVYGRALTANEVKQIFAGAP